jgi:hypothetical protein
MMRAILGLVLVLAVASAGFGQSDCLFKEYDLQDLASILQREGYASIEQTSERSLKFMVEGSPYLLILWDDGDLQMFCGLAGARVSLEDINEWNLNSRLATAAIDAEGDPILTADLLATAGINEDIVKNFVGYFVHNFGPKFRDFVGERNRAR